MARLELEAAITLDTGMPATSYDTQDAKDGIAAFL